MADINFVTLEGRLTRDPVLRPMSTGGNMSWFTLASNERHADRAGVWHEETAFVSCKVFGKPAEVLLNRKKGEQAIAIGRLRTEKWESGGMQRSELVLICDSVKFVCTATGSRGNGAEEQFEAAIAGGQGPQGGGNGRPPF